MTAAVLGLISGALGLVAAATACYTSRKCVRIAGDCIENNRLFIDEVNRLIENLAHSRNVIDLEREWSEFNRQLAEHDGREASD